MATAPPTASAVPAAPDRTDRATFSARATAFFDYVKNTMWSDMTAFSANAYANAVDAAASATAASTSEVNASASEINAAANAVAAASSSGAAMWVSGSFAAGQVRYSPTNQRVYRKVGGAGGTIDPASDAPNWGLVDTGLPVIAVTSVTQTATAGKHYILTNVAATTVTLPTGVTGATVWVTPANGIYTNTITPVGADTIMGLTETLTIDNPNATIELRFVNNSWRFV